MHYAYDLVDPINAINYTFFYLFTIVTKNKNCGAHFRVPLPLQYE